MKKAIAIALAALTVCLAPVGASAHHGQRLGQGVCAGIQSGFRHGAACHKNLTDLATTVFACVPPTDENGTGHCHVDGDGDYLCDDCGKKFYCNHADADGNGICDNCGNDWTCPHFDENGDGLCDMCNHSWSAGTGNGNGNGAGAGNGNGSGWGGHHSGGHHGGRHHG